MKLILNFDDNIVEIEENGNKNSLCIDLKENKSKIFEAIGLEEIPMDEIRNDINNLFSELGLNIKCNE
jgi:hypothetical protein